ncbi:MAG: guanine deaminase [Rhodospirillaceae bacterium]|nr:guanine deaminase [Rhodospirillaceae bacterium]
MANSLVLKGQTLSFTDDPFVVGPEAAAVFDTDGAVWLEDGLVKDLGRAADILSKAEGVPVVDYGDCLISAGFVDCHAHYPQLPVIASYGEQLLEWLERYTFPCESAFEDPTHARKAADFFLDEALKNGTTTAAVYATVHAGSVDAFFEAAGDRGLRMACGKVLMDRNAPDALLDTAKSGYEQSRALLEKWHGVGRNIYAITPRFAPTSTPEQLDAAGALWRDYPNALMQTHLSENADEIAWVGELFPEHPDYFGVYEAYGLTGPGAIFGHAIHLSDRERAALTESGSAIAHCPTSNMFIGSGLFDMAGLRGANDPATVGLASDVAGGSSLSMFATMRAAYEVAQLRGENLHPAKLWYLATLGSAKAMRLDDRIGNLSPGREADLIVIDPKSTPLIERRVSMGDDPWDVLFAQIILADDRAIRATYSGGTLVSERG